LLRSILSQYLQLKAQDIHFIYNAFGKPTLKNSTSLNFNVSHSNNLMLVAVTNGAEIGVDVEYIRKDFDNEDIADHYFSKSEAATFHSLPAKEKALAFYLCWTRKEAYIKAKERGLSLPLKHFDVTLRPGEPAKLLRTTFDENERWSLYNLSPAENYAGAVAMNAPSSNIQYFSI
jgi:4'-phosphopantetheinyl transferase